MATDRRILVPALLGAAACASPCSAGAASPTGWDAYRRIDLLPLLRTGEQARLASSYDRRGGNEDGGRWSCRRRVAGGRCLLAQHTGPGEIDSIWTTRPRAGDVRRTGTIRVELDGRRVLDGPLTAVVNGRLGAPFVFPAVANARQASGAVWIKVPMGFRQSMRITTTRNPGYFRVDYRTFDSAEGVTEFDPADPATDVIAALRAAGTRDPKPPAATETHTGPEGALAIPGAGTITELRVDFDHESSGSDRIRIGFDGRRTVYAPLNELLGSGLPARVRSLMDGQTRNGRVVSWWPMPFLRGAEISLAGPTAGRIAARVSRDPALPAALARGEAGYFRATSREAFTRRRRPWRVMEARGPGLLVGVSATLEGPRSQRHLEGDETIVADGRALRGTGTEDFFEGGFYWFHGTRSLPLVGSPAHTRRQGGCTNFGFDECRAMYRWLIADAVPFRRSLRFTLEHGDRNRVRGRYSTTALWYGR